MKKLFGFFVGTMLVCNSGYAMDSEFLSVDTSDPLYMVADNHILSTSGIQYGDDILKLSQEFAYGLNDRLGMHVSSGYQFDFISKRKERGFSSIELGGIYRSGLAEDNSAGISTDVLVGINFGGNRRVSDLGLRKNHLTKKSITDKTKYYAGVRIGRQWAGVSLSGTVKSTWIFDNTKGMALLDFTPEVYFRMVEGWRFGMGVTARLSTNPDFDKEWLNFKLLRQFGRTQYIGTYSYEYEEEESTVGAQVKILF